VIWLTRAFFFSARRHLVAPFYRLSRFTKVLRSSPGHVIGNAAPVQAAGGRILVPHNKDNRETWLVHSDDDGQTWSSPDGPRTDLQHPDWVWVGLGPPGGLRLERGPWAGRLVVPGYHGLVPLSNGSSFGSSITKGHALLSDDEGATWRLAADSAFGAPHQLNELQAAELRDGSLLINGRELNAKRVLVTSADGGETWPGPSWQAEALRETFQGCEGSMISDAAGNALYYTGVQVRISTHEASANDSSGKHRAFPLRIGYAPPRFIKLTFHGSCTAAMCR